ncbi:zinc finger 862-like [Paramuricea clavata]|uniref:Zinc finger 862-like n=1 Tax=Paramuricea clavata TaxID=317549 RepID=A0A6S7GZC0_PARCT|nr:zinc finger 862-like [Paramuricea clavata]
MKRQRTIESFSNFFLNKTPRQGSDDNNDILDNQEASTEEIPSETPASLTLIETETPALIGEPSSDTPVSSYKPPAEMAQAFEGKLSSHSQSRPSPFEFSETQHVCMIKEIFDTDSKHLKANKCTKYATIPGTRYRKVAIIENGSSEEHAQSIRQELLQRASWFQKELNKKAEVADEVLVKAFAAFYFTAKEEMANSKVMPLINFLRHYGSPDMKYFDHKSESDVAVTEQLVTFVQYVSSDVQVDTKFLSMRNLLEHHNSADADAIVDMLAQEIEEDKLQWASLAGLASDGTSVFTDKRGGVGVKLKKKQEEHMGGRSPIMQQLWLIPILDLVSKSFQKGSVTFSHIAPNLAYAKAKLKEEALSHKAIRDAVQDLKPNGRLSVQGVEVQVTECGLVEVDNLLHRYVAALTQHLDERFQESLPLFSLFSIFDPSLLPAVDSTEFSEYGKGEISNIGKIYVPNRIPEVVAEFELFKFHMAKFKIPEPSKLVGETQTEVVLKKLVHMKLLFPLLSLFAEAILSLPISNAWPERGGSAIKRIKTRLRSRLSNKMLESLLHISINGPEICTEECDQLIWEAVQLWLDKKKNG